MKKNILKALLPVLFAIPCLFGCDPDKGTDGYYASIDFTKRASVLTQDLHALMWKTHVNQIKYGSYSSYQQKTPDHDSVDQVPGKTLKEVFYTGSQKTYSYGNREHVWPAANSAGLWDHNVLKETSKSGGSDLYHVRPANADNNTLHGNGKYVDFDDPEFSGVTYEAYNYENTSNPQDPSDPHKLKVIGASTQSNGKQGYAQKIEVPDDFKGDVARILAYVYIHYARQSNTPTSAENLVANLSLSGALGYDNVERCKQKLVEWNELDPVSNVEKHRNDTVQKIQGNRNPFVDYPNLMAKVFVYDI